MKKTSSYLLIALAIIFLGLLGVEETQAESLPENAVDISVDVPAEITIAQEETVWLRFIPDETSEYSFYAETGWASIDIFRKTIFGLEWFSSAGKEYHNNMEAGQTYYFRVYNYSIDQTYRMILEEYLSFSRIKERTVIRLRRS